MGGIGACPPTRRGVLAVVLRWRVLSERARATTASADQPMLGLKAAVQLGGCQACMIEVEQSE